MTRRLYFRIMMVLMTYQVPTDITENQLYSVPYGQTKIAGWEMKNWQANGSDANEVTLSTLKVADVLSHR